MAKEKEEKEAHVLRSTRSLASGSVGVPKGKNLLEVTILPSLGAELCALVKPAGLEIVVKNPPKEEKKDGDK